MSDTTDNFKWLDLLEQEFDRKFVDVDLLLNDLDAIESAALADESDPPNLVAALRSRLTEFSAAFAQLIQKTQLSMENHARSEAKVVALTTDLERSRTHQLQLQLDVDRLLMQIHCEKLEARVRAAAVTTSGTPESSAPDLISDKSGNATASDSTETVPDEQRILKGLRSDLEQRREHLSSRAAQLESQLDLVRLDNVDMRRYVKLLQTELFGARLAARYLEKELAGRVQQIQLLNNAAGGIGSAAKKSSSGGGSGSGGGVGALNAQEQDRLWTVLESEIHLNRHKTVVRACQGPPTFSKAHSPGSASTAHASSGGAATTSAAGVSVPPREFWNQPRRVRLERRAGECLGMSVTGGREQGVPLIISELVAGGAAATCRQLCVGDAILAVNGRDLRQLPHKHAVKLLAEQSGGEMVLDVVYVHGGGRTASGGAGGSSSGSKHTAGIQPGSSEGDTDEVFDEDEEDVRQEFVSEDGYKYSLYDQRMSSMNPSHLRSVNTKQAPPPPNVTRPIQPPSHLSQQPQSQNNTLSREIANSSSHANKITNSNPAGEVMSEANSHAHHPQSQIISAHNINHQHYQQHQQQYAGQSE